MKTMSLVGRTPTTVRNLPEAVLHRELSSFNRQRLAPTLPDAKWRDAIVSEAWWKTLEGEFIEGERATAALEMGEVPSEEEDFVQWFEALEAHGPGQRDPLFRWLATQAPFSSLRWFLEQEVAGEAGFDDLVAMTQVKMPSTPKLELARNYWDEMGRGTAGGMHGPMLARLSDDLGLAPSNDTVVWESLALSNLLIAFATNRRYAYHAIGALGAVELTAPGRAELVNAGLKRHGVPAKTRQYYALHATLDVKHSIDWNREVLRPLVRTQPECARAIAEGAWLRLRAGARCFERYRRELSLPMGA